MDLPYVKFALAPRTLHALPALVLASFIAACGSGSGTSGPMSPVAAGVPATVSVGSITGFGSVHLNGRKFETTSTNITVDGQPASQSDLQVGDVIEVRGHHDAASGRDVADEIQMHSNVQGPVSAVDAPNQTLVVLGQTVLVSASTSFGSGIAPASLQAIQVGDLLQVSGMPAANGNIEATRIERKGAGAALRVVGTAATVDSTAKTLTINALTVDFSTAALTGFPTSGPKAGDLVETSGTGLDTAGALVAIRLALRGAQQLKAEATAESQVEGLISRFASAADFDVAGVSVVTTSTTRFVGGTGTDLALSVRVEAEGSIDGTGALVADVVRIEREADSRLVAQVDAVDATAGTLTLLGVPISVTAMTRLEDHGAQKVNNFSLANVRSGDWLDVRGVAGSSAGSVLVATRLERRGPAPGVLLAGPASGVASPQFNILSVKVATLATTQFADAKGATIDANAFFSAVGGRLAAVFGTWDGATLAASKATLGNTESEGEDN